MSRLVCARGGRFSLENGLRFFTPELMSISISDERPLPSWYDQGPSSRIALGPFPSIWPLTCRKQVRATWVELQEVTQ